MANSRARAADIGHGTDTDEDRAWGGGAQPTGEPDTQDSAGGGRGVGLGISTILGALLILVPIVWAAFYLMQAGAAGLGGGFTFLVGVVLLAAIGFGVVLLRGMFKS